MVMASLQGNVYWILGDSQWLNCWHGGAAVVHNNIIIKEPIAAARAAGTSFDNSFSRMGRQKAGHELK